MDHEALLSRPRGAAVAAAAVTAAGYAALYSLGRTSGSTRAEQRRTLPGDDLIDGPTLVTNHAATLPAPPDAVWPWLTQVGWHRGGWYTPRWVDRLLFPGNWPSADHLDPTLLRDLAPGDTVPDGPPGTAEFVVEVADAPHVLVLHSRTHLPPGWTVVTVVELVIAVAALLLDLLLPALVLAVLAGISLFVRREGPGTLGFHHLHPPRVVNTVGLFFFYLVGPAQARW
ncbi:hypothetical protein [Fodinibacter luteus]|uniref:hypothetical protein n=1 Tax=Fodinibacter luteus TaxID=552064 RepID=UPI0031EFC4B5